MSHMYHKVIYSFYLIKISPESQNMQILFMFTIFSDDTRCLPPHFILSALGISDLLFTLVKIAKRTVTEFSK